jgi:hypothetical protein
VRVMAAIPSNTKLDSGLALLRQGYECIPIRYEGPARDLTVPLSRTPTQPRSRFRIGAEAGR